MAEDEKVIWDQIQRGLHQVVTVQTQDQENRLVLLWIHTTVAAYVGVAMILNGTSPSWEEWIGHTARYYVGIPPVIAAFVLATGLIIRGKKAYGLLFEMVGLTMLVLWNIALLYGLVRGLTQHVVPGSVRWFGVGLYGGYIGMLGVHLWTLVRRTGYYPKLHRSRRSE